MPNFRTLGLILKNFKIFAKISFMLYSNVTVGVLVRVYSNVIVRVTYSNVIVRAYHSDVIS